MAEWQNTWKIKQRNGFFRSYMGGQGLDIGYAGYDDSPVILPTALGIDLDYPGYDGKILPFEDGQFDYIYSSHCLEHVDNEIDTITEWFRVIKTHGHLVLVVPHKFLYEKKQSLPSNWNEGHKRFFTPATLLAAVEAALQPNHYRVRLLEDGDYGFDYSIPANKHSGGQYEITLVLQKITPPAWTID